MGANKELFREVKQEILKIVLFNSFMDALIVFFVGYFIVSLFNIKFVYTLAIPGAITIIFFAVVFIIRMNRARLKHMEDANPEVKEILRTAYDNQKDEGVMTAALFSELKQKMRNVSSGNLLESKKVITRIITTVVIVFVIIFVSALNINLAKIDVPFDQLKFMIPQSDREVQEGSLTDLVFNETEVVYGDSSIAKLGNEEVNLNMNPSMSEIDFNQVSEEDDRQLRESEIPQEVAVNPEAFNKQEILEEAEQAANYSQRIKDI